MAEEFDDIRSGFWGDRIALARVLGLKSLRNVACGTVIHSTNCLKDTASIEVLNDR